MWGYKEQKFGMQAKMALGKGNNLLKMLNEKI